RSRRCRAARRSARSTAAPRRGADVGAFVAIARSGLSGVILHPLRSAATVACVVALLAPVQAGLAVARGLEDHAPDPRAAGPGRLVPGERFGAAVPVPLAAADTLRGLEGVVSAEPRIVGSVSLGIERVATVVVGVDPRALPEGVRIVEGRLFSPDATNEL